MVLEPVIRSLNLLLALDWRLRCDASLFNEVSHGVNPLFAFDDVSIERLFVFKIAWVELLLQAGEDVGWVTAVGTVGVRESCWCRFIMQERLFSEVGIGGKAWRCLLFDSECPFVIPAALAGEGSNIVY